MFNQSNLKEAGELCLSKNSATLTPQSLSRPLFPSFCGRLILGAILFLVLSWVTWSVSAHAEIGMASFYGTECCRFNPDKRCPTASGVSLYDLERTGELFAASWKYRLGSKVKVTDLRTGRSVIVTILDRGPAKRLGRIIDLGKRAFATLDRTERGIIKVKVDELRADLRTDLSAG